MDLQASLDKLEDLQELEEKIEQNRKDKQNLYLDVERQREKLQELQEEREKAKVERQQCRKEADSREIEVKKAEAKNEKLEFQRNTTKNNAQFKAMGQAIAGNLADIEKWETEELELLERADEMKEREGQLDRKLEEARRELQKVKERVSLRAREYEETIETLEHQRRSLKEDIAPKVLNEYENLSRSWGSSALVEANNRVCQGCFTTIPKQTENLLMRGHDIVHCHNCGRMLCLKHGGSSW